MVAASDARLKAVLAVLSVARCVFLMAVANVVKPLDATRELCETEYAFAMAPSAITVVQIRSATTRRLNSRMAPFNWSCNWKLEVEGKMGRSDRSSRGCPMVGSSERCEEALITPPNKIK